MSKQQKQTNTGVNLQAMRSMRLLQKQKNENGEEIENEFNENNFQKISKKKKEILSSSQPEENNNYEFKSINNIMKMNLNFLENDKISQSKQNFYINSQNSEVENKINFSKKQSNLEQENFNQLQNVNNIQKINEINLSIPKSLYNIDGIQNLLVDKNLEINFNLSEEEIRKYNIFCFFLFKFLNNLKMSLYNIINNNEDEFHSEIKVYSDNDVNKFIIFQIKFYKSIHYDYFDYIPIDNKFVFSNDYSIFEREIEILKEDIEKFLNKILEFKNLN